MTQVEEKNEKLLRTAEKHRMAEAERRRAASLTHQDIGELPAVVNLERKERCRTSFRDFCESYFPLIFYLGWSDDQLEVIATAERVVVSGGQHAYAMPRGGGKTTIAEVASLWAVLYGYRLYPIIIGADQGAAGGNLETIETQLKTNELLLEDFPEVCYPIRKLEGVHQRKIRYRGKLVHFEFTANRIILPNIEGSAAADAVIEATGITSGIRGRKYARQDGRPVRPDLALVDDPQTRESAKSPSQVAEREHLIMADVMGLAGPGKKMAALMPMTVVFPNDLADRFLDRKRYPQWQGKRAKMLYALPKEMKAWEEYWEIRSNELLNGGDGARATAFYSENRARMDAGAVVAWPDRHNPDEISALQCAMNLRFANLETFQAEYQNEPLAPKGDDLEVISAAGIMEKMNGVKRGVVPLNLHRLTAFVDVQGSALYWLVLATTDDFTGAVVDYGVFPEQSRSYFTLVDIKNTLRVAAKKAGAAEQTDEGLILWGLGRVADRLLGTEWMRQDGIAMKVGKMLVDANWGDSTDIVYTFCRDSKFASQLMPSHGKYVGAKSQPWSQFATKPGDRVGMRWRVPAGHGKRTIRHVVFDTNYWKTFVHARLRGGVGDKGGYALPLVAAPKGAPNPHQLLADHLTAESPLQVSVGGRTVQEWKERVRGADNHWLDCLVGASVAASMEGAALLGQPVVKKKRKVWTSADFQRSA